MLHEYLGDPQVLVEITSRCNFACDYCSSSFRERTKIDMSTELFLRIIKQISSVTSKPIRFHIDGEPTAHPNFYEFATIANKHSQKIVLATNGSLLQADYLTLDMNLLITTSTDAEEFRARHKAMDFTRYNSRIIDYIRDWSLTDSPQNITLQVPYLPEGRNDSEYQKSKEKYINMLIDSTGIRSTCSPNPKSPLVFHNKNGTRFSILKLNVVSKGLYPQKGIKSEGPLTTSGFCDSPWKRMAILADGRVSFCCIDLSGSTAYTLPEEIWETPLSELWNNHPEIKKIRQNFLDKNISLDVCRKCLGAVSGHKRTVGFG